MRAALGIRPHTGWGVCVALASDAGRPTVLDRRRLALVDPTYPRQVYHAARELGPPWRKDHREATAAALMALARAGASPRVSPPTPSGSAP